MIIHSIQVLPSTVTSLGPGPGAQADPGQCHESVTDAGLSAGPGRPGALAAQARFGLPGLSLSVAGSDIRVMMLAGGSESLAAAATAAAVACPAVT